MLGYLRHAKAQDWLELHLEEADRARFVVGKQPHGAVVSLDDDCGWAQGHGRRRPCDGRPAQKLAAGSPEA
eukprot:scaffold375750_cov43-Prasinocladus_malaysianus.AAC.3